MKVSIKTLLGDKYKEGMTLDEMENLLAELDLHDDEDSKTIEKLKNSVSKGNSEASEWKKKYQATLTEQEQKETARAEELESLKQELAGFKKTAQIAEYKAELLALGYSDELAAKTAQAMSDGDMKTVFTNHKTAFEARLADEKKKILKGTPAPSGGEKGKDVTKEQFKGMTLAEKQALATENPTLYQSLTE